MSFLALSCWFVDLIVRSSESLLALSSWLVGSDFEI